MLSSTFFKRWEKRKNKNFKCIESESPEPHPIHWLVGDEPERGEVGSTPNGSQCLPCGVGKQNKTKQTKKKQKEI